VQGAATTEGDRMTDVPTPEEAQALGCDPVGRTEIAERCGITPSAVDNWRAKYPDFPLHRWTVGGKRVFNWPDIQAWLTATGRTTPPT
jgi:hypothetical protein